MSNMPRGTFMQVMEKYTKSLKAFISAQGFGHYSKPTNGIPKTDLDQSVQTSLGKADTALQTFTESDPTVPAWAKASSKPSYTASEVGLGKVGNFKAVSTEASQGLSDTEKANARANMGGGDLLEAIWWYTKDRFSECGSNFIRKSRFGFTV